MPKLPPVLVATIAAIIALTLVYNIYADINVQGYDGYPTTLLLGGMLGGLLGLHRYIKGGDDK